MQMSITYINDLIDLHKVGVIEYTDFKKAILESEYVDSCFSKWLDEISKDTAILTEENYLNKPFDLFLKERIYLDFSEDSLSTLVLPLTDLKLID